MKYDFSRVPDITGIGIKDEWRMPENAKANYKEEYFSGANMRFPLAPELARALAERAAKPFDYIGADARYYAAVTGWLRERRRWDVRQEAILPFYGILQAVMTSALALLHPGERIIVFPSSYSNYMLREAAARAGFGFEEVELLRGEDGGYRLDLAAAERAMALPDSRMLILVNPDNPTGTVWTHEDLVRLAELANRHGVIIFSDEIFGEVVMGGQRVTPMSRADCGIEQAVVCTSPSKAFNLVGTVHSNLIIENPELMTQMKAYISRTFLRDMDPFMYTATVTAYTECGGWLDSAMAYCGANARRLEAFLRKHLPQVRMSPIAATYMAWIDWNGLLRGEDELRAFLEDEAHVYVDYGSMYGRSASGFTRFNAALPADVLERALSRISAAAKARGIYRE